MSFADFLGGEGIKVGKDGIPQILVDAFDSVADQVKLSYGPPGPNPPVPNPGIIIAGVSTILAEGGGDAAAAAGATILFTLVMKDIASLIYPVLTMGMAGLLKPVPLGVPGVPLTATAFIPAPPGGSGPPADPQTQKFGKAFLKWAISFISPADPRIIAPFTVP